MYNLFKSLVILIVLISFIGCKDKTYVTNEVQPGEQTEREQTVEGVYHFYDGAYFEVYEDEFELYIPNDGQFLTTVNPENGTYGELPALGLGTISKKQLREIDGNLVYTLSKNINYTSGHDVEEDVSGSNITGQKRTDIRLTFFSNGQMQIIVSIYDNRMRDNINEVVAVRSFLSEEL